MKILLIVYFPLSFAFLATHQKKKTQLFSFKDDDTDKPPSLEDTIRKRNYIVQRVRANRGDPEDVKSYVSPNKMAPLVNQSMKQGKRGGGDPEDVKQGSSTLATWMSAEPNYDIIESARTSSSESDPEGVKWQNSGERMAPWMLADPRAAAPEKDKTPAQPILHMKLNQAEQQAKREAGDREDVKWQNNGERLASWTKATVPKDSTSASEPVKLSSAQQEPKESKRVAGDPEEIKWARTGEKVASWTKAEAPPGNTTKVLHMKMKETAEKEPKEAAGDAEDIKKYDGHKEALWMKAEARSVESSSAPRISLNTVGGPQPKEKPIAGDPEEVKWTSSGEKVAPWMKADPKTQDKAKILHMKMKAPAKQESEVAGDAEDVKKVESGREALWMQAESRGKQVSKKSSDVQEKPSRTEEIAEPPQEKKKARITWVMEEKPKKTEDKNEPILGGAESTPKKREVNIGSSGDPEGVKWENKGDRLAPWMSNKAESENTESTKAPILGWAGVKKKEKDDKSDSSSYSGDPEGVKWENGGERLAPWMSNDSQSDTQEKSVKAPILGWAGVKKKEKEDDKSASSSYSGDPEGVKWQNKGERLAPWMMEKQQSEESAEPVAPILGGVDQQQKPNENSNDSGDPKEVKWQNKGDRLAPWMIKGDKGDQNNSKRPILGGASLWSKQVEESKPMKGDPEGVKWQNKGDRLAPWMKAENKVPSEAVKRLAEPFSDMNKEKSPERGPQGVDYWTKQSNRRVANWMDEADS